MTRIAKIIELISKIEVQIHPHFYIIKTNLIQMKKFICLLMVLGIVLSSTSCDDNDGPPISPCNFVLVAGAWQGAWSWKEVKENLLKAGNNVFVVELPGHGDDNTPPKDASMDAYRDRTIGVIEKIPGKVILVGHSMAGMVVTAVSEKIPSKIEKVIYIGAFIPANGQSIIDLISTDTTSMLTPSIIPTEDQLQLDVKRDRIIDIFCQDGSAEVKKLIVDKFRLEPAIPFTNKLTLTNNGFGKVTKHFIHTEFDHAIPAKFQRRMVEAAGRVTTHSLETGHSPHLSHPDELTKLLLRIAFF